MHSKWQLFPATPSVTHNYQLFMCVMFTLSLDDAIVLMTLSGKLIYTVEKEKRRREERG